jgi:hypothetical protein
MIEVLKQAYQLLLTEPHAPTVCNQLEVILRQAIAELESQEPVGEVGWLAHVPNTIKEVYWEKGSPPIGTKLYTALPQRSESSGKPSAWVGLTDEEAQWIYDNGRTPSGMMEMVEAKLKERNNA